MLKDIFGKKRYSSKCVTQSLKGGNTSSEKKQNIIYGFNYYFINVGADIANKIEADTKDKTDTSNSAKHNADFIFITPTSNDEIVKLFSKHKT